MGKVIAFAGKGGVGKTTVATLVIRHLSVNGETPILAVDADRITSYNVCYTKLLRTAHM